MKLDTCNNSASLHPHLATTQFLALPMKDAQVASHEQQMAQQLFELRVLYCDVDMDVQYSSFRSSVGVHSFLTTSITTGSVGSWSLQDQME